MSQTHVYNGKESLTSNGITKLMNSIFAEYADGKKISTSMIRVIKITDEMKGEDTIKQKEEKEKKVENDYQHSSKIQDQYRKID